MDRSIRFVSNRTLGMVLLMLCIATASGCIHQLLATGIYLTQGGNMVDAEYDGLESKRVVVMCQPPASNEYRHAGAARGVARRLTGILATNVSGIDVVDSKEVDNWADESDWDDFKELGKAVEADMLVHVSLGHFKLHKGRTLYQGDADITVSIYDMAEGGRLVWEDQIGEMLYPRHSGVPAQDKSESTFQREFEHVIAQAIALHFYKHEAHTDFAIDALANR